MQHVLLIASTTRLAAHDTPRRQWPKTELWFEASLSITWSDRPTATDIIAPLALWTLTNDDVKYKVALCQKNNQNIFNVVRFVEPSKHVDPPALHQDEIAKSLTQSLAKMAGDQTARDHLFHWQGYRDLPDNDDPNTSVRPSVDQIIGHLSTQPAIVSGALRLSRVVKVRLQDITDKIGPMPTDWYIALVPTLTPNAASTFPATALKGLETHHSLSPHEDDDPNVTVKDLVVFNYDPSADTTAPPLWCVTKPLPLTSMLPPAAKPGDPKRDGQLHTDTMWVHSPAAGSMADDRDWLAELPTAVAEAMDPLLTLATALSADSRDVPPVPNGAAELTPEVAHGLLKYAMYAGLFEERTENVASDWVFAVDQLTIGQQIRANSKRKDTARFGAWATAVAATLKDPDESNAFAAAAATKPGDLTALAVRVQSRLCSDQIPPDLAGKPATVADHPLRDVVKAVWGSIGIGTGLDAALANIAGLRQRLARDRSEQPGLTPARDPAQRLPVWATIATAAHSANATDPSARRLAAAVAAAAELVQAFDRWSALSTPAIPADQRQWLDARVKGVLTPNPTDSINYDALADPDPNRPRSAIERRALNLAAQMFPPSNHSDPEESRCDRPGVQPLVLPLDLVGHGNNDPLRQKEDPFRQFAGLGVLMRRRGRANAPQDDTLKRPPGSTKWACLNMAELQLRNLNTSKDSQTVASAPSAIEPRIGPVVAPYRPPYSGQMHTGLPSYNNMPLVAESHVAKAVPSAAVSKSATQAMPDLAPGMSWTLAPLAVKPNNGSTPAWSDLPALIDGYAYDVAAFLIGNGGTLPPGLTAPDGHPATLVALNQAPQSLAADPAFDVSTRRVKNFRRVGVGPPRIAAAATGVRGRSAGFPAVPKTVHPLAGDVVHSPALPPDNRDSQAITDAALAGREPLLLLAPQAGGHFYNSAYFDVRPPAIDLAMWDRAFGAIIAGAADDQKPALLDQRLTVWQAYYRAAFRHDDKAKTLDDPMVCYAGDPSLTPGVPVGQRRCRLRVRWENAWKTIDHDSVVAEPQAADDLGASHVDGAFDYGGHSLPAHLIVKRSDETSNPDGANPPAGTLVLHLPAGVWRVTLAYELNPGYCADDSADRRFALGVFPERTPAQKRFFSTETSFLVEVVPPLTKLYDEQRHALIAGAPNFRPRANLPQSIDDWHAELDRPSPNRFADPPTPNAPVPNLLPDPDELWGRLKPVYEAGRLRLELTLPNPEVNPAFAFMTSATVALQRWRWNGQPLKPPSWALPFDPHLDPKPVLNKGRLLTALTDAMKWEVSAFSDRQDSDALTHTVQLPFRGGVAVLNDTPAGDDPRSQYLRLTATVSGRYPRMPGADVSPIGATFVPPAASGALAVNTPWRRVLIDARPTAPLPPPAVRLAVPLTRGVGTGASGRPASHCILVVTDEAWYEKAGLLEQFEPAIVLNEQWDDQGKRSSVPEIGSDPIVTTKAIPASSMSLNVIGPVGHTDDLDAAAPRIRASSFVLSLDGPADSPRDWTFAKLRFRRRVLRPAGPPQLATAPTTTPARSSEANDPLYVSEYTDPVWVQFLPPADDTPLSAAVSHSTALLASPGRNQPLRLSPAVMAKSDAINEKLANDRNSGFEWWVLLTTVAPANPRAGRDESYYAVLPLRSGQDGHIELPPVLGSADKVLLARLLRVQVTRVAGVVQSLIIEPSPPAAPASAEPPDQSFDVKFWESLFGRPGDEDLEPKDVRGRIVSVSDPIPASELAVDWFAGLAERQADEPGPVARPVKPSPWGRPS